MKKALIFVAAMLLAGVAAAQLQIPLGDQPPAPREEKKKEKTQSRSLYGVVLNKDDAALAQAIVYLKNMKTLAVKTFIAENSGEYRFNGLSPYVDYEIYAEYQGRKSDTKTFSTFDSRPNAKINLRVDTSKEAAKDK